MVEKPQYMFKDMQKGEVPTLSTAHTAPRIQRSPRRADPDDFRGDQTYEPGTPQQPEGTQTRKWHSVAEALTETGPLRRQTARDRERTRQERGR